MRPEGAAPEEEGSTFDAVRDVLGALLVLPGRVRADVLAAADVADDVRREVASLLGHADDEPIDLEPGHGEPPEHPDRIGEYDIVRVLGFGGMGIVYEVRQPSIGRRAALKVLNDPYASETQRLRMKLEIEVLGKLDHPGVAKIYAAGTDDSGPRPRPYFLMEYVAGEPIDRWVRARNLELDAIVDLVLGVCDAVEHAHRNGVLHRDIKPDNVMVDAEGRPRVLDFGIARPVEGADSLGLTAPGSGLVGTLAYMSPEQCSTEPTLLDVRTDVFALGTLLYELVCGRRPLDLGGRNVVQALRAICETPPDPATFRGRPLPRDLEAILQKALAKDRADRYATTAALSDDLRRWRKRLPVEARAPGRWRRLLGWAARHPVRMTTLASLVVAGLSVALTMLVIWRLGFRPDRLVVEEELYRAQLRSITGRVLATWEGVADGAWIDDDDGDLVVLARPYGRYTAHRVSDPDDVLWVAEPPAINPSREPANRVTPNHTWMRVADVFPDLPGLEIIVGDRLSPQSPSVVRVLDSDGETLYEVWNNGQTRNGLWMPATRMLACAGYLSTPTWLERGVELDHNTWPVVVFALRPRAGHRETRHFVIEPGHRDPTLCWYQWVGPIETLKRSPELEGLVAHFPAGELPTLALNLFLGPRESNDRLRLSLFLAAGGEEIDRLPVDAYLGAVARDEVPEPEAWQLLPYDELPPEVPRDESPSAGSESDR